MSQRKATGGAHGDGSQQHVDSRSSGHFVRLGGAPRLGGAAGRSVERSATVRRSEEARRADETGETGGQRQRRLRPDREQLGRAG
ncbi:hypothetical protein AURDEDRAFT_112873 [Auricularia subglabra TFB-10046 SS5]|nr:hypothetical protein AURDEDRAFT_112873 [Auricularia subglabra TFB-10046 SS5]